MSRPTKTGVRIHTHHDLLTDLSRVPDPSEIPAPHTAHYIGRGAWLGHTPWNSETTDEKIIMEDSYEH